MNSKAWRISLSPLVFQVGGLLIEYRACLFTLNYEAKKVPSTMIVVQRKGNAVNDV